MPFYQCATDPARVELDERIVKDLLGLGEDALASVARLRTLLASDPSIHGSKKPELAVVSSSVEAVLWDETIQAWLDDYPSLERHELERRLASRERVAALFELLLHAILKRHRAQVVVHPTFCIKDGE